MSAGASFICRAAGRRCCAAIPASSSRAARRCWSGWRRSRRSWKARRSHSPSTTTMSRRSAPGATACAATSRTPRASDASRSAFPMSSSTCRPAPRKRSAPSIPQIMGMQAELLNGDATVARVKVGKDQYLQFRETDRPQPEFDGHHVQIYITDFSGPYHRLQRARPDLAGRQPVSIPLSRHRRSRRRQAAVHRRARGPQRHAPDVHAAAGQPQPGRDQPHLRARPRAVGSTRWGRMSMTKGR